MNDECSINDKDLYAQTSKEDPAPIRILLAEKYSRVGLRMVWENRVFHQRIQATETHTLIETQTSKEAPAPIRFSWQRVF